MRGSDKWPPARKCTLLLQLFVHSPESSTFTCKQTSGEFIVNWQKLAHELLHQFCNTQKRIGGFGANQDKAEGD